MVLTGDTSVIGAIKEKKRLMDAGEAHEHMQIMMVCGGGCFKAAYSWGACLALAQAGYRNCFSTIVGSSSGALASAYFLSGNILEEKDLIQKEVANKVFFNLWRPFQILDTAYLRTVIAGDSGHGLNTEAILSHPTKFILGVSRYNDANPVLIEPTTREQLLSGLQATISMGGAVSEPICINGVRYFDGENTLPYIRHKVYAELNYTHVLDLTNQEVNAPTNNWLERLLLPTLYRGVTNRAVRQAAYNRFRNRVAFLQGIAKVSSKPVCVVYGDNSVSSYESDSATLQKAVERSRGFWLSALTTG